MACQLNLAFPGSQRGQVACFIIHLAAWCNREEPVSGGAGIFRGLVFPAAKG